MALALCMVIALSTQAMAAPKVQQLAAGVGRDLDRQLGGAVSLMVTTPVHIDNLRETNTLARQMQEEIMTWFVKAGYSVQEIRKAGSILVDENTGEFAITRKPGLLSSKKPSAAAVVTGTYVITPFAVRFNIKVVSASGMETLAMSAITVPITRELKALLGTGSGSLGAASVAVNTGSGGPGFPIEPTVVTRLP